MKNQSEPSEPDRPQRENLSAELTDGDGLALSRGIATLPSGDLSGRYTEHTHTRPGTSLDDEAPRFLKTAKATYKISRFQKCESGQYVHYHFDLIS